MLKDGVQALTDALVEVLQLPVNVAGGLLKFADVMQVPIANQARPWSAVLVAIFIIVLPFILDKCQSKASRLICAYGVLCLLFMLLLIGFSSISLFAQYDVAGQFEIKTIQNIQNVDTSPTIRYGSDSCDANESHHERFCSSKIQQFVTASVTISGANCGSGVNNVRIDPADKKCILADSHMQGCGYDRLPFGINNCKGRGWLQFALNGSGSSLIEQTSDPKPFSGTTSARDPLVVDLGQPLGINDRLEFKVDIRDADKILAELTDAKPSEGDFTASIRPDGKLQVTYGKKTAN